MTDYTFLWKMYVTDDGYPVVEFAATIYGKEADVGPFGSYGAYSFIKQVPVRYDEKAREWIFGKRPIPVSRIAEKIKSRISKEMSPEDTCCYQLVEEFPWRIKVPGFSMERLAEMRSELTDLLRGE